MTRFTDGPAAGRTLSLARQPHFLRVVVDWTGKVDALDQLEDTAEPAEKLFAYKKLPGDTVMFIDGTRGGRRAGWVEKLSNYSMLEKQPDDAAMRSNEQWREWCKEQPKT